MNEQDLNAIALGFCGQLKSFVSALHGNTTQLRADISKKPPAYGDLSSFLLDFNDRVAEATAQVDQLEEMTVENVSFEELLAHCLELYKQTETSIASLESHLEQFGYAKGETAAEGEEKEALELSFVEGLKQRVRAKEFSPRGSTENRDDMITAQLAEQLFNSSGSSSRSHGIFDTIRSSGPLGRPQSHLGALQSPFPRTPAQINDSDDITTLGEAPTLESLGISALSLASLARLNPNAEEGADVPAQQQEQARQQEQAVPVTAASENGSDDMDESCGSSPPNSPTCKEGEQINGNKSVSSSPILGPVTDEEYDQVLPWLKKRVTLEELNDAVVKISDAFHISQSELSGNKSNDGKVLELEESFLLGLGSKMKTCLLILVHIDRLVVACRNACTYYRPSELAKFR